MTLSLYVEMPTDWIDGAVVLFHHKALSPYSCYEVTFHQLLTFTVLFLTFIYLLKQKLKYFSTRLGSALRPCGIAAVVVKGVVMTS